MASILNVKYEGKPCYDIIIENNYDRLFTELKKFNIGNRNICIVSESNVAPYYANFLIDNIQKLCKKVTLYVFDAGEASKNLDTVYGVYEHLITNGFDRNDMILALGGGVVGDLAGFTASTYLRGIRFVQLPTSLLSQVDSSIGGKTGVDYKGYKNMVGAFYQPSLVYMNLSTLKTLPEREYLSGMGEIIKHGFIKNRDYLYWLKDNADAIKNLDFEAMEYMIFNSCIVKKNVVESDPKETLGERALLNFGHTLGHAIEKCCNFSMLHGECVSLGMISALKISEDKGYISDDDYNFGINLLELYKLPVDIKGISKDEVINTTKYDKKMDGDKIKFILLEELGNAIINKEITTEDMYNSLENVVIE